MLITAKYKNVDYLTKAGGMSGLVCIFIRIFIHRIAFRMPYLRVPLIPVILSLSLPILPAGRPMCVT